MDISVFNNFVFWFLVVFVVSYRLREVPHIWSKAEGYRLRFAFMYGDWFTKTNKSSWFSDLLGINTFNDAFHFFGNLPRILISLYVFFKVDWIYGLVTFAVYYLLDKLVFSIIVKPDCK